MLDLSGIMTALVTPLKADGTVDEQALTKLIDYQIDHKVNSLLLLGGTGEYTSMTMAERLRAVDLTVKAVKGRVPLVVGVLETGIGECLNFCSYCKKAGADAMLVLTPFYIMGTQDALADFYLELDRKVDMPILIYNIPYRTNVNVLPDTVLRLSKEMKNLVGIKECASMTQAMEVLLKVGDKINVLTGDEFSAVSLMAMGVKGAVMATANVVPDAWVQMYQLVKEGKIQQAMAMSLDYFPLFKALFSENYISPLKYAMDKAGIPWGEAKLLPLLEARDDTKAWVDREMKRLGVI
ncbi:4-hydroxy-tetrahydrodipicolinate synthase [Flavonifractor sp. An100]|uniref:4-hydroxy-tetrahydrodipicolinate synthase n=1 Tax=Flavonifractor sp. An100 TaxID=1965538 RepID=UPI000B3655BF|nr:4-hydroxy-tetrahydrodipicolinate synthase [Flavonifractor sp. An100]OUQ76884.1 4-hydroxy-tetrahydrodipicolinate synthase [Flavonifractor sp. An100]